MQVALEVERRDEIGLAAVTVGETVGPQLRLGARPEGPGIDRTVTVAFVPLRRRKTNNTNDIVQILETEAPRVGQNKGGSETVRCRGTL